EFPLAFVRFDTPAVVTAGTRYAIVLKTRAASPAYAMAATAQPYGGGQLLFDTGNGWTTLNGAGSGAVTLRFQTMVIRARGNDPWPIGYTDFGAYAMCDFDYGTRDICPDQGQPHVPCFR